MRSPRTAGLIALLGAALAGCGSAPPPPPPATVATTVAASATPKAKAAVESDLPKPVKRDRSSAAKAKVAHLFQIPQFTRAANSTDNAPREGTGAAPQIRLLGFSRLDGELRALVQIKGETLPIDQGDIIDGAEVVAIDDEGVSFQYAGQRWTSRLFEKLEVPPVTIARAGTPPASGTAAEASPLVVSPDNPPN